MPSRSLKLMLWNRYSKADGTLTSSGEADSELHPVEFTKNFAVGDTWRSSGVAGDTYIIRDLGTTYKIKGIGVVARNITRVGKIRVRIGNTSDFSTNLYDSGEVFFQNPIYTSAERFATSLYPDNYLSEFFDSNGRGQSGTLRNNLKLPVRTLEIPTEITARYARIDFIDPLNPRGFVDISHIYLGRVLEPSPDILYGYKVARTNTARLPQAASGQFWPANLYERVRMSFTFAPQRESDMVGYWYLLEMLIGMSEPVIVTLEDITDNMRFYTSIFGMFVQNPQNTNIAFKRHQFSFDLEESMTAASYDN